MEDNRVSIVRNLLWWPIELVHAFVTKRNLIRRLNELLEAYDELYTKWRVAVDEAETKDHQIKRLLEYADHDPDCDMLASRNEPRECTCGLNSIIRELEESNE
jgi:hypothetical protein